MLCYKIEWQFSVCSMYSHILLIKVSRSYMVSLASGAALYLSFRPFSMLLFWWFHCFKIASSKKNPIRTILDKKTSMSLHLPMKLCMVMTYLSGVRFQINWLLADLLSDVLLVKWLNQLLCNPEQDVIQKVIVMVILFQKRYIKIGNGKRN